MTTMISTMRTEPRASFALPSRFVLALVPCSVVLIALLSLRRPPVPDTSQHRPSRALSSVPDESHDPYAFSRVGNRLFGAGSARHSSPPQISCRETSAPFIVSGLSSILPSYPSPGTTLPLYPPSASQSSTAAPSLLNSTPAAPLLAPSTAPGNGTYASDQVTRRDNIQFPTEADVDELYAFFLQQSRTDAASCYVLILFLGGRDVDATDVDQFNKPGPQFTPSLETVVSGKTPRRDIPPSSAPPAPPFHALADPVREAGTSRTSSAVIAVSSGPSRSRKRKATTPPPGEAEHVEGQTIRGKPSAKGKGTAAEPEPEAGPESASEPEDADEDAQGSVVESKEALRSRKRRGRRKDLIRSLYKEMEKSIRVEPFETLSLDEVVELAVSFLNGRRDLEQQKDVQIQRLQAIMTAAQSEINMNNVKLQTSASELNATKQERAVLRERLKNAKEEVEGMRFNLGTVTEELRRHAEDARRHAGESQRHAEVAQKNAEEAQREKIRAQQYEAEARQLKLQVYQLQTLLKQNLDQVTQKEHELVSTGAELQCFREDFNPQSQPLPRASENR
ncbi:hypothetical protein EVG20_g7271 [Dentipellis fragilis]|uniref:Uncharacterized protein n=1 Tax=Dentipellis fragilis TaxID=205917 RepID=A0A4Y9YE86_9AGAM|nr:hypothetical protein EVG20_g7271 [Dentipellis fragilis]